MVEEDVVQRAAVASDALQGAVGGGDGRVVRRKEREAVEALVERVEERDVTGLVRRRVVERQRRALQHRLERGERVVVRRDGVAEVLGHLEHVVDDEDGEVADRGDVDHRRVVLLVQDVRLAVFTDRPRDDLRLVALEMHGVGVVVQRLAEGDVRVVSFYIAEVARHDVVGEDVCEGVGVASEVARCARPCITRKYTPFGPLTALLTSIVVGREQHERAAICDVSQDLLARGSTVNRRGDADELGEPGAGERGDDVLEHGHVLRHGGRGGEGQAEEGSVSHRGGRAWGRRGVS